MVRANNGEIIPTVAFCVLVGLVFPVSGNGDECVSNLTNMVVYEGQVNIIMNFYVNPRNVSWTVIPVLNPVTTYQIVSYGNIWELSMHDLYDLNQTGLIIKNATISGSPIPTAGLYSAQCRPTRNPNVRPIYEEVKLAVIRSGPLCACDSINSTSTNVSCSATFADFSDNLNYKYPITAFLTWRLNGINLKESLQSVTRPPIDSLIYLSSVTNTIISTNTVDADNYECELTFSASGSVVYGMNRNNPVFSATCTGCGSTTKRPTTTTTTTTTSTTTTLTTTTPTTTTSTTTTLTTTTPTTTTSTTTTLTTTTPTTRTGRNYSTLTKKPTSTADVDGSRNITLECASIYGTDIICWYFTLLGSSSNETIQISQGYDLLGNNRQLYGLQTTSTSSVLVILQLTKSTEGTYTCSDGVDSASALLLIIPKPISVSPLFGPVAGGTNITILGSSVTIDYILRHFGSYVSVISGIRNVYIGTNLLATSVFPMDMNSSAFDVVAVTPSTLTKQTQPIIIEFSPNPFNLTLNKEFIYRDNPEITAISPNSFIVDGGTLLHVTGRDLSSVANPIIQLTVDITRADENGSTTHRSTTSESRVCTVSPGSGTSMQCPMPPLNIPDDFLEVLNSLYNSSITRKRRSGHLKNPLTSNSYGLLSRMKRSANVQTVNGTGPNGNDKAVFTLGFNLDGLKEYENINNRLPGTKVAFYSAPEIPASNQVLEFDPSEDEFIYVKGKYMLRGCRMADYLVHIGDQPCNNNDLQDNQLSCRPPKTQPSSTNNDKLYCNQHLSIPISIGNKQYHYSCMTYTDNYSRRVPLIVGLTVGLGGGAILIAIIIVSILCCRSRQVMIVTDRIVTDRRNSSGRQEIRGNVQYNAQCTESIELEREAEEDLYCGNSNPMDTCS